MVSVAKSVTLKLEMDVLAIVRANSPLTNDPATRKNNNFESSTRLDSLYGTERVIGLRNTDTLAVNRLLTSSLPCGDVSDSLNNCNRATPIKIIQDTSPPH